MRSYAIHALVIAAMVALAISATVVRSAGPVTFAYDTTIELTGATYSTFTILAGSEVTSLTVEASTFRASIPTGSTLRLRTSAATNFVDSGLGCDYEFSIPGAVNVVLTPAQCFPRKEVDVTPPGTPTNIQTTTTPSTVTITWTDPDDPDLASVAILRNSGGATAISGTPYATTGRRGQWYRDTRVIVGETYRYLLRATDTSGNVGKATAEVVVTVSVAAVPVAPPPAPVAVPVSDAERSAATGVLERIFPVDRVRALTNSQRDALTAYTVHGSSETSRNISRERREELLTTFRDVYGELPTTAFDLRALDVLTQRMDGATITEPAEFRDAVARRRAQIETFRIINGRLPGREVDAIEDVDADWWALWHLTSNVAPQEVDVARERRAIRMFREKGLAGKLDGSASAGVAPQSRTHWRAIRACVYGNPTSCALLRGVIAVDESER